MTTVKWQAMAPKRAKSYSNIIKYLINAIDCCDDGVSVSVRDNLIEVKEYCDQQYRINVQMQK